MKADMKQIATEYTKKGFSVIPVYLKTKKPDLPEWKPYQLRTMNSEEVQKYFNGNTEGIAFICGSVNGNTEILDFDNKVGTAKANLKAFKENPLVKAIFDKYQFPIESTQSGGFHVSYRCSTITKSMKLAKDFLSNGKATAIIETKGEGGYFVCDPTPGYKLLSGSFLDIPEITPHERNLLFKVALSFDKTGGQDKSGKQSKLQQGEGKLLTEFDNNGLGPIQDLLEEAGWQLSDLQPRDENKVYYTRPGKDTKKGHSATLHTKLKQFYVFTSSSDFEAETSYSLSEALSVLQPEEDSAPEEVKESTLEEATKSIVKEIPEFENTSGFKTEKQKAAAITLAILSKKPDIGKLNGELFLFTGKYWQKLTEYESLDFIRESGKKAGFTEIEVTMHTLLESAYKNLIIKREVIQLYAKTENAAINLQNGTLKISKEKTILKPHNKEDRLTYILPFGYYEQAEAPLFEQFLNKVLPDRKLQDLVAEFIGYSFLNMKMEKAMIFHGSGQNGKSVTAEIITGLLGSENTSSVSMSNLIQPNGYYRPMIAGKRINIGTDEAMKQFHSDIFKKLVSGEEIEARNIYGKPFNMKEYAKLLFLMNKLPATEDFSKAFFRRLIIIPFRVYITDEEKIIDLHKLIMEDEKPGILNWILFGVERLLMNERFTESYTAETALNEYRNDSNSVISFILEEWQKQSSVPEGHRQLKGMYLDYVTWCKESGRKPVGKITFSDRLHLAGFEKSRDSITGEVVFNLNDEIKTKIEHG